SIVTDLTTNKVYLYGKAQVDYGNISLTAAQIEINQNNSEVTARGYRDSTGRLRDIPVFKQGEDTFESDSMRYNFKSQRGIISGAVTQEGEGYIQGQKAKRMQDGTVYTKGGRYTTCNLAHPHWYIRANKIKLIPDKQVVSGPFYLVLADIPTPLGFAFGIFPFTEQRKSGLVFPVYGESADRGFFLRNGGYFWAINDYMTLDVLGEIYTRGGWGLSSTFNYRKRYRLSGNAQIRFNRRVQGEDDDRSVADDFWLRWTHTPIPRGRSSLSASVNFGTTRFNQRNEFNPINQITNNFASSVSFRTSFDVRGTTVSLGLSARQDQNSRTEVMNVTLPDVNLAINRIYPFKKKGVSPKNFIQKINFSYSLDGTARFTNQVPNNNAFPFPVVEEATSVDENTDGSPPGFFENFPEVLRNSQIGVSHNIPISTTIKLFKYFSLNPNLRYQEVWYPKRLNYTWIDSLNAVQVDTVNRFSRVYSYSLGASLTTRIYGTFFVPKPEKNRWLQGIRHTMIPTIGFSFRPDFSKERFGFFQNVQIDSTGENFRLVSRYLNFQPGAPAGGGENGIITFSLNNIFEAKFRAKDDTAGTRKVTLLDNLSFSSSYNLVADSLNLAPINISARTKLLQKVDLNFTGTLDPYVYRALSFNEDGSVASQVRINRFAWQEGRGIGQLRNFNISLSTSLTPEAFKREKREKIDKFAEKAENEGASPDQLAVLES
ncbi:MAG: putative LPS assembly protein LptD, partial [Bacteroidota bacterium]